ncbi:MAG: tetratricopeptide repeat protein [Pseudomonadota bacterium]
MKAEVRVEIDFYQQDEAGVYLETTSAGNDEKFAEILLFCCFANRQMVLLKNDYKGQYSTLATLLKGIAEDLDKFLDLPRDSAARLVEYRGPQGRKRFSAYLKFGESDFKFKVTPGGFGLLGRGVGYYAPNAVLILLEYLIRRRKVDPSYLKALGEAVWGCAVAYLGGFTTISSQSNIAMQVTATAFSSAYEMQSGQDSPEELREAAEAGDAQAQLLLGHHHYALGDYANSVYWYAKAAEQKHPAACRGLADMYREGLGIDKDSSEAVFWYRAAVKYGDSAAKANLAYCLLDGLGVEKDIEQGMRLLTESAHDGVAQAQFSLGNHFRTGRGVSKSITEAVKWFEMAAEQGDVQAQTSLGNLYALGKEVLQDYDKAAEWYGSAALEGYAPAQFCLGTMYMRGEGVDHDPDQGLDLCLRAADQGLPEAEHAVGFIYEKYRKDIPKAVEWYTLSANKGYGLAIKALERIAQGID